MNKLFAILFSLYVLFSVSLKAQETTAETITVNNKQYYKHIVQKGETLYAISKKYNVSVDDIKKANKGLGESLSLNQEILIPIRRNTQNADSAYVPKNKSDYLEVTVQKGQTLYSISKSYGVSLNDLIAINPTIENGLKEGQIIYIPIKKLKENQFPNFWHFLRKLTLPLNLKMIW